MRSAPGRLLAESVGALFLLIFSCILLFPQSAKALPQKLGDLDEDGVLTILDLIRLINHIDNTDRLSGDLVLFAHLNQDGVINQAVVDFLSDAILNIRQLPPVPLVGPVETSPANGEGGVAVTRETIFRFNLPLSPSAVLTTNNLYATFGGRRILSRIELSSDRKKVTLFYLEPLPASARIRVTFEAAGLSDYLNRPLDLNLDGNPGGNSHLDFDTLSITPVAGTAVIGHVYASVQVPVVGTNTTNFVDHPIAHVRITVDGADDDRFGQPRIEAFTDSNGFFVLSNCPAGRFFVTINGHTSFESDWPNGAYYPVVGKPWETVAGRTNLAGNSSSTNSGLIYLPLVQAGTLQPVNPIADTTIGFPTNI